MKTQRDFFIYLAGYVDGDGCFRCNITTQKSGIIVYERSITISSTKKEVIFFFNKTFGGYISTKKAHKNQKKAYIWTIKGNAAGKLAFNIKSFLVNKAKECDFFIDFCKVIKPNCFLKPAFKIIEKRNDLISKIRQENHHNGLITKEAIVSLKTSKKSIKPTDKDYIYLAGLIDAEGCLRISSRFRNRNNKREKIYNTVFEIGNTKIKMMEWLIKRFGGSLTYISPRRKNKLHAATWALYAKSLYPILFKIKPFLFNKKAVCEELIKFQATILPNGGDRHSKVFTTDFKKRIILREKIIKEVHKLNHKGNY